MSELDYIEIDERRGEARRSVARDDSERRSEERRVCSRFTSYWNGTIIFDDMETTLSCLIKNYSWFGALLVITDYKSIPEFFEVSVQKQGFRHNLKCQLIWREKMGVGVRFC